MRMTPPVAPYRGTRSIDAFGGGGYNAPRSKSGTKYGHKGLDFKAEVGDDVVMPFGGILLAPGLAYPDATLGSIHIEGAGDWLGYAAKILYAKQEPLAVPQSFAAGAVIAKAQDVASYHEHKSPGIGSMTNHVHFELRKDGLVIDPTPFFLPA